MTTTQRAPKNFSKGKIYKICSYLGPDIYIGSTTKERLCQRMTAHRGSYNAWKRGKCDKVMAYELFEKFGIENCKIELIENFPCNSNDELEARESHYIRTMACVNKIVIGRTNKQYYKDNKEQLLVKKKQYRKDNKQEISERDKQYYEGNKEKISERDKQPVVCECGSTVIHGNLSRHRKSIKHTTFINTK